MVAGWAVAGLLAIAYSWWVVSLPPFSGWATVAVMLTGALAVGLGAARRRPERRRRRPTGTAAWAVLAAALGAWQLAAYLQHPRDDHPTLSSLTNAVLDSHPTRAVAFFLWLLAAVELGRR